HPRAPSSNWRTRLSIRRGLIYYIAAPAFALSQSTCCVRHKRRGGLLSVRWRKRKRVALILLGRWISADSYVSILRIGKAPKHHLDSIQKSRFNLTHKL